MKLVSILPLFLLFLPYTLALHCWRDMTSCNPGFRRKYDSKCDISKNRILDLRLYRSALSGFCRRNSDLVFRIRPRDLPTTLPSGVVCRNKRYSRNASSYASKLAKAIKKKHPRKAKGAVIKCCEGGGMNKGCK